MYEEECITDDEQTCYTVYEKERKIKTTYMN